MSLERIDYRECRIDLTPLGGGWKAAVFLPGSTLAEVPILHSLNPVDRDVVIEQAKGKIDRYVDTGART